MTKFTHAATLAIALILVTIGCGLLAQTLSPLDPPPTFVYQNQLCHWNQGRASCEARHDD